MTPPKSKADITDRARAVVLSAMNQARLRGVPLEGQVCEAGDALADAFPDLPKAERTALALRLFREYLSHPAFTQRIADWRRTGERQSG
jgi:hypothetical protein